MEYKTCNHVHDNGYFCQSAAVTGRDYCCYHLRYRGRLMRMAQARARCERFDLRLPPLENMHAVQSALSQLVEALAADMIDPKRAQAIHSVLRTAANNFKHPGAWQTSACLNDHSAACPTSYEEFEAEFGLPEGIDLNAPPEVAFPPPPDASVMSGAPPLSPSFGDRVGDAEGPLFWAHRDRAPLFPDIPAPVVRDYTAEAEVAMFESTPEDMELNEIMKEQGYKAMERRAREHQRNQDRRRQRKLFRANYERYAAEAKLKNIQRAAEKLIAEKLAAEKAAAAKAQPVTSATPADDTTVSAATRKPPTSIDQGPLEAAEQPKEAQSIA
jgi:hypothetical protein